MGVHLPCPLHRPAVQGLSWLVQGAPTGVKQVPSAYTCWSTRRRPRTDRCRRAHTRRPRYRRPRRCRSCRRRRSYSQALANRVDTRRRSRRTSRGVAWAAGGRHGAPSLVKRQPLRQSPLAGPALRTVPRGRSCRCRSPPDAAAGTAVAVLAGGAVGVTIREGAVCDAWCGRGARRAQPVAAWCRETLGAGATLPGRHSPGMGAPCLRPSHRRRCGVAIVGTGGAVGVKQVPSALQWSAHSAPPSHGSTSEGWHTPSAVQESEPLQTSPSVHGVSAGSGRCSRRPARCTSRCSRRRRPLPGRCGVAAEHAPWAVQRSTAEQKTPSLQTVCAGWSWQVTLQQHDVPGAR